MSQISPLERVALDEENPWNIAEAHYPALGSVPEQLRFLLGYAILAPSRSNSQPWQFHRVEDTAAVVVATLGVAVSPATHRGNGKGELGWIGAISLAWRDSEV